MFKRFTLFMIMGVAFAYACDNDTVVVEHNCKANEKKCAGQDFMTCKNGAWEKKETCTESQVCDVNEASGCKAKTAEDCTGQPPRCDGKKYQVCENKLWKTEKTCGDNEECDVNEETHCKAKTEEDCTGQLPRCDGKKYQVCENKLWKTVKTCADNEECDVKEETHCKAKTEEDCTGQSPKCEGNIYQVCENRVWEIKAVCNAYEICSTEAAGCKEKPCENNSPSACDIFEGHMYHYKCVNNSYSGTGCVVGHACDPVIGCSNAIECATHEDCKDTRAVCENSVCALIKPLAILNPETNNPPGNISDNGGVFKVQLSGKMREKASLYLFAPGATISDPTEKTSKNREGGNEVPPVEIKLEPETAEVMFKITGCAARSVHVTAELYYQSFSRQINCGN